MDQYHKVGPTLGAKKWDPLPSKVVMVDRSKSQRGKNENWVQTDLVDLAQDFQESDPRLFIPNE